MLRRSHRPFKRYSGTSEQICRKILEDTYRGGHYRVSGGHFSEFYTRDFAFIAPALMRLGRMDRVRSTLSYALDRFSRAGRVTTSIDERGVAFDYPRYGPDSLALLLLTLSRTGNADLAREHSAFLQSETDRFVRRVVDPETLLPRRGARFSSIRDHTARDSSCYDACMVAVVAREAPKLGLRFPYGFARVRDAIMRTYWNGAYFFSDATRRSIVVGDANVFPFWTGVVTDARIRTQAFDSIRAAGLDEPWPLRYVSTADAKLERTRWSLAARLAPGYETDAIWAHLGLAYLEVLRSHDPKRAREHLATYERSIKEHGTFIEVYSSDGKPFCRLFYRTDEAMSWCAMWLALKS